MSIIPPQPYLENPGLLKEDISSLEGSVKSGGRLLQSGAYKLGNIIKANPREAGFVATGLLGGYALSNSDPLLLAGAGLGGGYLLTKIIQARKGKFSNNKNLINFEFYATRPNSNPNPGIPNELIDDTQQHKHEQTLARIKAEQLVHSTNTEQRMAGQTNQTNVTLAEIEAANKLKLAQLAADNEGRTGLLNKDTQIRLAEINNAGQEKTGLLNKETQIDLANITSEKEKFIAQTPQITKNETIVNGGQPGIGQQIAKVLTPRNIGIGAAGLLVVGGGLLAGKTYLDYKAQQDKNKRDIELEKLYRN